MFLEVPRSRKGPEWPQNGFKMNPKWARVAPRRPKRGPKVTKLIQDGPNMAHEGSKVAHESAKEGPR